MEADAAAAAAAGAAAPLWGAAPHVTCLLLLEVHGEVPRRAEAQLVVVRGGPLQEE